MVAFSREHKISDGEKGSLRKHVVGSPGSHDFTLWSGSPNLSWHVGDRVTMATTLQMRSSREPREDDKDQ